MANHPFWKISCAGLSVWATLAACQEPPKKSPLSTPTAVGTQTNKTIPPSSAPASGVQTGGVVNPCDPTDTKVAAACGSIAPPDARCATNPLPADLCEKVKTALAASQPSGTSGTSGTGGTTGGGTTGTGGTTPAKPAAGGKTCTVNVESTLTLRDKASTSGSSLADLPNGTSVKWISESNGWVHGEASGQTGYLCDTCKEGGDGADFLSCTGGGGLNLLDAPEPVSTPWPRSKATNPDGSFG